MIIDGLAAVHEDALSRAEGIDHGEEIRPIRHFLGGGPLFEGGLVHDLRPEVGVVHDAFVEGGEDAAGVQAVAGGTKRRDPHGYVLGIGQDAALGGAVEGEFRPRVGAGRADVEDGLDGGLDAVGLGHMDEGFKVGIGSTADKSGNRVSTYYFDNFSAEFAETSDEKVANFETKYQEVLALSNITNNEQANMMFNALAEFNSLGDSEKAQLTDASNKLETLRASWYITDDDFESEALLSEVWESIPETGDIQTANSKNEIVTTTLVSSADIVDVYRHMPNATVCISDSICNRIYGNIAERCKTQYYRI